MMERNESSGTTRSNVALAERAYRIRRNAVRMGAVQGQGYIAQALGIADVLAVAYFHALRYRPEDPDWEERDRFCLSIGHYAIALYAVLIEAGVIPGRRARDLRHRRQPAADVGHGLLHARHGDHRRLAGARPRHRRRHGAGPEAQGLEVARLQPAVRRRTGRGLDLGGGAVGAHWKLDNLIAIVDVNNQQADGPSTKVLNFEPLGPKWEAFGWHVQRVNGNDIDALVPAFDRARRARRADGRA